MLLTFGNYDFGILELMNREVGFWPRIEHGLNTDETQIWKRELAFISFDYPC